MSLLGTIRAPHIRPAGSILSSPSPHLPQADLRVLGMTLRERLEACTSIEAANKVLVQLVGPWADARVVACLRCDGNELPRIVLLGGNRADPAAIEKYSDQMLQAAKTAAKTGVGLTLELDEGQSLLCVARGSGAAECDALALIVSLLPAQAEPLLLLMHLAISELSLWRLTRQSAALDAEAKDAGAIIELLGGISSAASRQQGVQSLVDRIREYLNVQLVALGLTHAGGCRLAAVSGIADPNSGTEIVRLLETACDEARLNQFLTAWPTADTASPGAVRAHQALVEAMRGTNAISISLDGEEMQSVGALIIMGGSNSRQREDTERFLRTIAIPLGPALQTLSLATEGVLPRGWRGLQKLLCSRVGWIAAGIGVSAVLAAMFASVPYQVSSECIVQPVLRRYVAAPFAGQFETCLVKPGQFVRRGESLARMDGRELRMELAGLAAQEEHAAKSRDVNLAAGKVAAVQMAALDLKRILQRKELLQNRQEHLELKSPLDGIVISGDLRRSEGVPVEMGQTLFEIAPTDRMLFEIAIADADLPAVAAGLPVNMTLDAFPGMKFSGELASIHPRSEIRNDANVFIGEVLLDNPDGLLRPGMEGKARISAGRRPLGQVLGQRPWRAMWSWLGY